MFRRSRQVELEKKLSNWNNLIKLNPDDYQAYIQRGMIQFKLAKINEAIADFDYAEKLESGITPYLWQRGLAYYYAERYEEGAKQFEIDLQVNQNDLEETIWRYLCLAYNQGIDQAQKILILPNHDPRRIISQVYNFYQGNCTVEDVLLVGSQAGIKGNFYSHLYLGLYYEAHKQESLAKEYIIQAATKYPLEDYMWHLACVHQKIRNWS